MPTPTLIAADTSRFATGNKVIEDSTLLMLKGQHSVELLWPGAWHGASGYDAIQPTLKLARELDMLTGTYVAHTQRHAGANDVVEAYKRIGEVEWSKLQFVALDMEYGDPTTDPTVANMEDLLAGKDKVLSLGQRPVLYTANWWWKGHFENPDIPLGLGLINAFYDNDPDFDFASFPYGGPDVTLVGEQFTNTTDVDGVGFDFSSLTREWVMDGPPAANGLAALAKAWGIDMEDSIRGGVALHQGPIHPLALALYSIRQGQKAHNWELVLKGGK